MNQSFQEFLLIIMHRKTHRKNEKKNSKTGFQNLKPDFRFSINIPNHNHKKLTKSGAGHQLIY